MKNNGWWSRYLPVFVAFAFVPIGFCAAPVITSINPALASPGSKVTINGSNFSATSAGNIVYFGGVQAAVITASSSNLAVIVPAGATFAPISDTVNGLTAYSSSPFLPTFPGASPLSSNSLSNSFNLNGGNGPMGLVIGDMDGDGKPDLVVVDDNDAAVWIYRNIGSNGNLSAASFAAPVVLPFNGPLGSDNLVDVTLADLAGDGRLDIVTENENTGVVSVFQNLSSPGILTSNSFGPRIDFTVGNRPVSVAASDLDGDGKPDIIVADFGSGTISVLKNISTGGLLTSSSFAAPVSFGAPGNPSKVLTADVDNDGKIDVVTANYGTGSGISIFDNTSAPGNISFGPRVDLATPVSTEETIAVGDIDGDGKQDLIVGSYNDANFSVYRNIGSPGSITASSFAAPVTFAAGADIQRGGIALDDIDGDSRPDIAIVGEYSGSVYLYRNLSTPGSFTSASLATPVTFVSGANSITVVIGDLDGDGLPDIAIANQVGGNLTVWKNVVPSEVTNPPSSCTPAPSGIVSWWKAEDNANDSVGGNNGTLLGSVTYGPGEVGQAFMFNTTNDGVKIPASASLDVGAGNGFTLEAWVNPENVAVRNPIFEWNPASATQYWGPHFYIDPDTAGGLQPGTLLANIQDVNDNWHIISSVGGVITSNEFQHVALTYDKTSGMATIYYNGGIVAQQNVGVFTPKTGPDLYLGRRPISLGSPTYSFGGEIDEPAVYNRALSQEEIQAIYNAGSAGKCANGIAPTITSQPTNQTVEVGGKASFTVGASGTPPLTYQWYNGSVSIDGSTNTTLTLSEVTLSAAGTYYVTVSNPYGSTNISAILTVTNQPSSCTPAPSGLVGWWRAEGNANDAVGTNNGTLLGGLGFTSGEVGQAFDFNNGSDGVLVNPSPSLAVQSMTIEAWINPTDVSDYHPIVEYGADTGLEPVDFMYGWTAVGTTPGALFGIFRVGSSQALQISSAANIVPVNQWSHVALTFDYATQTGILYLNGTNVVANVSPYPGILTPQTSLPIHLGYRPDTSGEARAGTRLSGGLDEVGIYNRALSQSEIQAIYNARSAGKCFVPVAPMITSQPSDETVESGGTASFTVGASGSPTLTYQWYDGSGSIGEATNSTLTLSNVTLSAAGSYYVTVSSPYGSTNSASVTLTVTSPAHAVPVITAFTPSSGATGTVINIQGLNFSATASNNVVYFGAVQAEVTSSTSSNLTVTVPVGATFAPISETVNGLTAYSGTPFLPTFPGTSPLSSTSLSNSFNLVAGSGPYKVVIADIDGDGKPDLIIDNDFEATIWIYRNNSANGSLSAASFAPPVKLQAATTLGPTDNLSQLVAADLDGDGRLDIVVANYYNGVVSVFQNLSSPGNLTSNSFGSRLDFTVGSQPVSVAVSDLDGDGKPEIITADFGSSTISILRNVSTPGLLSSDSFAAAIGFATPANTSDVAVGDLNGDGKLDIVTANDSTSADAVSIFGNTSTVGNISFAPRLDLAGNAVHEEGVTIGDIDGDGKPDLIVGSYYQVNFSVYRNIGSPGSITSSSFAAPVTFNAGGPIHRGGIALADIDGDGKPDLAIVDQDSGNLFLYRNLSTPGTFNTGSLGTPVTFTAGFNSATVAVGDLNGDGRPDIVIANTYGNNLTVWENAVSVAGTTPPPSPTPAPASIGAWWKAESNALDSIGGNNGTLINGAGFEPGEVDTAFSLNGTTSYVLVQSANSNLNIGTGSGMTIEGWINPNTVNQQQLLCEWERALGTFDGSDVGVDFAIQASTQLYANITDTSGNSHEIYSPANLLSPNVWQHVAMTYDTNSGVGALYINGVLVASQSIGSFTPETSFSNFLIGGRTTFASESNPVTMFGGGIDEWTLYNSALSQSDIQAIYSAGSAGKYSVPATSPPSCTLAPSGQVGWWRAEGNALDSAGGNNGVVTGAVSYATGEVGQAFHFTDTNEDIVIPASSNLNVGLGAGLTVEAWINPDNVTNYNPVFEWNPGDGINYWGVGMFVLSGSVYNSSPVPGTLYANVQGVGDVWHQLWSAPGTVTNGGFQHVALTYDKASGVATLYYNGAVVAQQTFGSFTPKTIANLHIGRRPTDPAGERETFIGLIDEASVYNRALSQSEIQAIYNARSAGKCFVPVAPMITSQPTNETVVVGETASFTAAASGSPTLMYQWYNGSGSIGGATNSTLTLSNVQLSAAGIYYVTVSNPYGSTNSASATLAVTNPTSSSCTPAPSGIVSWWRAENNANDIVGSNNGTLLGSVTYGPGEVGQAFMFNTTNDGVRIPASASLDVGAGNGFTLEAWVNPENVAVRNPIFEWNPASATQYWGPHFYIDPDTAGGLQPGTLLANIQDVNDNWHIISSAGGVITSNEFQHVALTYDKTSGMATIYYNGSIVAQQNVGVFTPKTGPDLYLGRRPTSLGSPTYSFGGEIDEPAVYNRVLSQDEIAEIYNAGSAGKCFSSVLTAPPVITSISPVLGDAGSAVTITGSNFSATAANNIVYFGGVQAVVTSASTSSLTVTVPSGATFAPISETVNGLTAYSSSPFLLTFPGTSPLSSTSLSNSFNLPGGSGAYGLVIADIDGDGKPDLIFDNDYDATIWIYRNIGSNGNLSAGSFAPPVILQGASSISGIDNLVDLTVADLDGDGRLDIVVANLRHNVVSVFQNLSSPGVLNSNSFGTRIDLPVGSQPVSVAVGDLDGDGKPDIIAGNMGDATLSILRNINTGGLLTSNSFAAAMSLALPGGGSKVVARDVDGDGKIDLVTANWGTASGVSLFDNTSTPGSISFAPRVDMATPVTTEETLAVGDIDGDGKPDLIVGAYIDANFSVYRNIGSPGSITTSSFATPVTFSAGVDLQRGGIAFGDIDGDGKPDVAIVGQYSDNVYLYRNLSTPGSFTSSSLATPVTFATGDNATTVAIGDLDGDGRPDIAIANAFGDNLTVWKNVVPIVGANQPPVADASATVSPVISPNGTNATVLLDGSLSHDPDGDPLQYVWIANGVPVGSGITLQTILPVGTNQITLVVSDGISSNQQTIAVQVITVAEAIQQLSLLVTTDFSKAQSMAALLANAIKSVDKSNPTAAINQLQAFQHQVNAQIAPLDPVLAQLLVQDAQNIIDVLSGSPKNPGNSVVLPGNGAASLFVRHANGHAYLGFLGAHQQSYSVEASSDLAHWSKIGSAQEVLSGSFEFEDLSSTNVPTRFYRIVAP